MADEPSSARASFVRAYRLLVLVGIVLVVHRHAAAIRSADERPVTLREVRTFLPSAEELDSEGLESGAWLVLGSNGQVLGRALRTSPRADAVVGYVGPSDVLIVLNTKERILGASLRRSHDTPGHVRDVAQDEGFWSALEGLERSDVVRAGLDVDGVTGATRTSRCVLDGIALRLSPPDRPTPALTITRHDGVVFALTLGLVFVTLGRGRWKRHARLILRIAVLVYLGLVAGDLLALSLAGGWTAAGSPWRAAPGMCALALAVVVLPWSSGRDAYCQHACPHGALQEWILKRTPRRWRVSIPALLEPGLARIPVALLGVGVLVTLLALPLDLAGFEPFDAYVLGGAGVLSVGLAVISLLTAPVVPMGYCRYGCPTGALLRWVRVEKRARLSAGDAFAGLLLLLTVAGARWHQELWSWLEGWA